MLTRRIIDIAKDSSIYGLSKVLSKLIGFFLIPLYTSYLTPTDYGILSLVGISSTALSIFMTFALDSATYRFVGLSKDKNDQQAYVSNAQFMSFFFLVICSGLVLLFKVKLFELILTYDSPIIYIMIGVGIAVFSSISSIPRAYLRINREVKSITIASIVNVLGSVLLTIYFLVVLKLGVMGALLGNLSGNLLSSIVILTRVPLFQPSLISIKKCKKLILYSLPMLPSQIFAFAMPVYSQFFVKEFMSFRDLGLYSVGLKFTMPLSLALAMFQQAYAPYKYEIIKTDSNAKSTFSRIMTVFVIGVGCLFILLSFYGGFFLKLMTNNSFHEASELIFYLLLIPLSSSYYFMFSTGLEFAKRPVLKPVISGTGLLTVIFTIKPLVTSFGVAGTAISISLGWFVMTIGHYLYAQSYYRVKYNWLVIIGVTSFVLILGYLFTLDFEYKEWLKLIVVLAGLLIVYFTQARNKDILNNLKRE